jgi:hypothetical protein
LPPVYFGQQIVGAFGRVAFGQSVGAWAERDVGLGGQVREQERVLGQQADLSSARRHEVDLSTIGS